MLKNMIKITYERTAKLRDFGRYIKILSLFRLVTNKKDNQKVYNGIGLSNSYTTDEIRKITQS